MAPEAAIRTFIGVERAEVLAALPRAYGLVLRLSDLGADTELIAECLGIEPEAVGPLLSVAAAKLEHIQNIDLRDPADDRDDRRSPAGKKGRR